MKKQFILFLLLLITSKQIVSQTEFKPWNIAISGGKTEYRGDLSKTGLNALFGNAFWNFEKAFYGFAAVSVSRYVNKKFDISVQGSVGNYGYFKSPAQRFRGLSTLLYLDGRYKLIQKRKSKFVPSIYLGLGGDLLTSYTIVPGIDFIMCAGLGLDYQITPSISFRFKTTFSYTTHDNRDGLVSGHSNDAFYMHSLGVTYCFGERVSGYRYFKIFGKTIQIGP